MMKEFIVSKQKIIIIFGFVLVIFIIAIINQIFKNNNFYANASDNEKFREEYEKLNNEKTSDGKEYPKVNISVNNIEYITIDETLKILDNGTRAIYIGYAECLYCRSAVQVLVDTAKDLELESIYYLDINEIWNIKEIDENNNIITTKETHEKYNNFLKELNDNYIENYILTNKDGKEIDTEEKNKSTISYLYS